MTSLKIKNLTKNYGPKLIFSDLNIYLDSDHIYFLTSLNGSGKTTFFKCLLREAPFYGSILDEGLEYIYLPERNTFPLYTKALDFIQMYLRLNKIKISPFIINKYFEYFKISEYLNSYVHTLSKGTKQKILIIKTLLTDADVYLFDEPLSGLDEQSRQIFMGFVKSLKEQGKIIIIATHYYEEYRFNEKVVIDL